MRKLLILALLLGAVPGSKLFAESTEQQRVEESRMAVQEFAATLKQELKEALQQGGPMQAIAVCGAAAPSIAQQHSARHGWKIGRTSLKPRNRNNAPDSWEKEVLERFEQLKAAGGNPAEMEFYQTMEQNGKRVFRYMKAIPTAEKPCLTCHGSNIDPKLAAVLDERYPEDKARGYKAGEIRGAFTITQPLQ